MQSELDRTRGPASLALESRSVLAEEGALEKSFNLDTLEALYEWRLSN